MNRRNDHNLGGRANHLGEMPTDVYPGRQQVPSPGDAVALPADPSEPPVPIVRTTAYSEQPQAVSSARAIRVLNANPSRKFLLIQNNGTGVPATSSAIRVGYGKAPTLASHRIVSDGVFAPEIVPTDAIWILGETADVQAVVVIEG
jgi:hypothetical protein